MKQGTYRHPIEILRDEFIKSNLMRMPSNATNLDASIVRRTSDLVFDATLDHDHKAQVMNAVKKFERVGRSSVGPHTEAIRALLFEKRRRFS